MKKSKKSTIKLDDSGILWLFLSDHGYTKVIKLSK
jgi:hypothetical protein